MNTMIEKHCTPTKTKLALVTFATVLAAACLVAVRPTVALAEDLDDNFNNPAAAETVEEVAEDQEALPADEATVPTEEQATPQEGSDNLSDNATEETPETVPEPSLDEPAAQDAALDEQTTDDQASAGLENDTDESEVPSSSDEPSTSDSGANGADVSEPAVASPTNTVEPASEKGNTEATPQLTESERVNQLAAELTSTVALAVQATSSVSKFVVVLDPGHGGSDSGAIGNGLRESDLTLSIAKYAKAQLDKLSGVVVYLTRTSDVYVGLEERVNMAYKWGANLFVSIHINDSGVPGGPASGFEVFAQNNSAYRNNLHVESLELANRIAANERALGLSSHGTAVKTGTFSTSNSYPSPADENRYYPSPGGYADYLSVLRNSRLKGIPAVLVENLFIDNASDASWLRSDANRKKLGIAIANAITEQYDLHQNLVRDEKGVRYIEDGATTYLKNAWKTVGNDTYYFGSDGYAVKYTQDLVGTDGKQHRYYFSGAGVMQTGFVTWSSGTRSFFAQNSNYIPTGAAFTGWVITGGKTYYFRPTDYRAARYSNKLPGRDGQEHDYYFNGLGQMFTGLLVWGNGGRSYYDSKSGIALTGWQEVSKNTYYFNPNSLLAVKYTQDLVGTDGKQHRYYFSGAGVMQTGFVTWSSGTRSFFAQNSNYIPTGAAFTGWVITGGKTYYFRPTDYRAARYSNKLPGRDGTQRNYYFNGTGAMQTGWIRWANGTRSYYEPNKTLASYGAKYTGEHLIGSAVCTFDDDGILQSEVNQGEDIMGVSLTTVAQMVKHYTATVGAAAYPSSVYKSKGAATINDFCKILFDEAVAEGVRAEVVYAQTMLETNYLRFGGDVKVGQCNFAGIGATGGVPGNSFKDVTTGLRAQVQHLKAYASTEPLNKACVDPRFDLVERGCAPTISGLTGKWAVSSAYGNSLKEILSSLLQTK